jgi:hypothetical protein
MLIMVDVRQVVSNNNSDIVDFLLRNKFSSLSYDDKLFVGRTVSSCHVKFSKARTAPIVIFMFHGMKSASGLHVAKLGIDCFVGRAYFFLNNVKVRGTLQALTILKRSVGHCKNTVFQKITHTRSTKI